MPSEDFISNMLAGFASRCEALVERCEALEKRCADLDSRISVLELWQKPPFMVRGKNVKLDMSRLRPGMVVNCDDPHNLTQEEVDEAANKDE